MFPMHSIDTYDLSIRHLEFVGVPSGPGNEYFGKCV
jgi:hypothetical protein